MNRKAPLKIKITTFKSASCGLAAPPYDRAKPINLRSNATVATRGHLPVFVETLARHSTSRLEGMPSAYTPTSAGSALVIGKIVPKMFITAIKIN